MLNVSGLEAGYGASQVLFGIDLSVQASEVVTLLGRNGMGKTTTINAIMGIVPALAGSIDFAGQALHPLPPYEIARRGLGLVPEGRQIFPNLSVWENLVATSANLTAHPDPWTVERIFELFPELAARRNQMGDLLSGASSKCWLSAAP